MQRNIERAQVKHSSEYQIDSFDLSALISRKPGLLGMIAKAHIRDDNRGSER